MTADWRAHEADIRRMAAAGMTDAQVGAVFGKSAPAMYSVRRKLGIPSNYRPDGNRFRQHIDALAAPVVLDGETYTDAAGRTVTRYPARWAAGALVQSVTARPRRG